MKRKLIYILCAAMLMGIASCSQGYHPYQTGDSYTHRKKKNRSLFITKKHLFERKKEKDKPFW